MLSKDIKVGSRNEVAEHYKLLMDILLKDTSEQCAVYLSATKGEGKIYLPLSVSLDPLIKAKDEGKIDFFCTVGIGENKMRIYFR